MDTLPEVPINLILAYLDSRSLVRLSETSTSWRDYCNYEGLWESLCLREFPLFFWTGTCQDVDPYTPPNPPPLDVLITDTSSSSDKPTPPHKFKAIPVFGQKEDPRFERCTLRHVRQKGHRFAPLPQRFRKAYGVIYSGKYAGYIQVLGQEGFDMAARSAVAKYNKTTKKLDVQYKLFTEFVGLGIKALEIARRHEVPMDQAFEIWTVISEQNEFTVEDSFDVVTDRPFLRRFPDDVLNSVTSAVSIPNYVADRSLWPNPNAPFEIGEEVEIQWGPPVLGSISSFSFQWWRGYVKDIIPASETLDLDAQVTTIDENGVISEVESRAHMIVAFNQFPRDCTWYSVPVSMSGLVRRNPTSGYVGGIRRLTCGAEKRLWRQNLVIRHGWRQAHGDADVEIFDYYP
ncbi:hypothetical protein HK098_003243 [Nowakowskiella sp. JEL0407]|nr:hypothetical protein HK098_003243 [Nowakowskiella sp. JEL0407]